MNLTLAIILSKNNTNDACVWYLINIVLDTTIGMVLCFIIFKSIEVCALRKGLMVGIE